MTCMKYGRCACFVKSYSYKCVTRHIKTSYPSTHKSTHSFSTTKIAPKMFDHTLQTHYEVLGIGPYADIFEIKSAYKARALKPHPNKNGGTPKAKKAFQHVYCLLTL